MPEVAGSSPASSTTSPHGTSTNRRSSGRESRLAALDPISSPVVNARLRIIALCFLLSGATGLVYQVVWLRMLGVVFGHSLYAITAVLAAFMAGLTLGSVLFARYAARLRDPVRAYGLMEIGIGCYCVAVPLLFR